MRSGWCEREHGRVVAILLILRALAAAGRSRPRPAAPSRGRRHPRALPPARRASRSRSRRSRGRDHGGVASATGPATSVPRRPTRGGGGGRSRTHFPARPVPRKRTGRRLEGGPAVTTTGRPREVVQRTAMAARSRQRSTPAPPATHPDIAGRDLAADRPDPEDASPRALDVSLRSRVRHMRGCIAGATRIGPRAQSPSPSRDRRPGPRGRARTSAVAGRSRGGHRGPRSRRGAPGNDGSHMSVATLPRRSQRGESVRRSARGSGHTRQDAVAALIRSARPRPPCTRRRMPSRPWATTRRSLGPASNRHCARIGGLRLQLARGPAARPFSGPATRGLDHRSAVRVRQGTFARVRISTTLWYLRERQVPSAITPDARRRQGSTSGRPRTGSDAPDRVRRRVRVVGVGAREGGGAVAEDPVAGHLEARDPRCARTRRRGGFRVHRLALPEGARPPRSSVRT